ncbi:nitroreductase family protein [Pectobacterium aroidearum]|uniref:nitroreductase family protein n=1 Tax=Pectobacterium aroidearum TaxID=1201031 RepID=UPI0032EC3F55
MSYPALDIFKKRRTQYALGKNLPASQTDVTALIQEAVRLTPSSFNSQSSRVVILFGAQNDKFWQLTKDALRQVVPADAFEQTEKKLDNFAAGAGTVLFFEDQEVVRGLQERFALYAENFPVWSEQSSGMAQFAVWTVLANSNIGASLQHYNPLIDAAVTETWNLPRDWKLRAQMPFGANAAVIGDKSFIADSERFLIFQ